MAIISSIMYSSGGNHRLEPIISHSASSLPVRYHVDCSVISGAQLYPLGTLNGLVNTFCPLFSPQAQPLCFCVQRFPFSIRASFSVILCFGSGSSSSLPAYSVSLYIFAIFLSNSFEFPLGRITHKPQNSATDVHPALIVSPPALIRFILPETFRDQQCSNKATGLIISSSLRNLDRVTPIIKLLNSVARGSLTVSCIIYLGLSASPVTKVA